MEANHLKSWARLPLLAAASLLAGCVTSPVADHPLTGLPRTGIVDERFLSYNIEMAELTGGRFWRPFGSPGTDPQEYRPPIDLSDRRMRSFAAALAPAYVRYSGTWANATWFADREDAPAKPPAGFDTVLTHRQWRGAVEFAAAVGARIVTSFATSPGTRDAKGVWQPDMAARWLAFTRTVGGSIAATEFANEPNMVALTQAPPGYRAEDYRRDYARFAGWLRTASPETLLLAPGVAELGEPTRSRSRENKERVIFEADQLIARDSPRPDAFSFHYYGGASLRCGQMGQSIAAALSPAWLEGIDAAIARVSAVRDRVAPGTPLWNTESAESACGGNAWASAFADSFRFVDTLGRSARQGVRVFMHNTLAASDYGLLEEHGYAPRPNYWAAVLWKRTMGTTVLAAPPSPSPDVRIYAHCLVGRRGGVGLAALNLGDTAQPIAIGAAARAWLLRASALDSKAVAVSGRTPRLEPNGRLSGLEGVAAAGSVALPGKAIAFIAVGDAGNPACR